MSQRISRSDSRVLHLSIDSSFSTQSECYFAPLLGLVFEIWSFSLQTDWMSRVKPARGTINRLPARRPFAGVTTVRRCIESQAGNHSERVTLPCVDGDPSAWAAITVVAKLR